MSQTTSQHFQNFLESEDMSRNIDWIGVFATTLMLGALIIGLFFYYYNFAEECTANPLKFGAKKHAEEFEAIEPSFGSLTIFSREGDVIVIHFNESDIKRIR